MNAGAKTILTACSIAVCLASSQLPAVAVAGDAPAQNPAMVLLRVLAYDRNLKARATGGAIIVALVHGSDS
jgi:hypothetical protein